MIFFQAILNFILYVWLWIVNMNYQGKADLQICVYALAWHDLSVCEIIQFKFMHSVQMQPLKLFGN